MNEDQPKRVQLPREQWKPILNEAGEQVGWNTGKDEIKFSTPERFQQAEGIMALAMAAKARQGLQPKRGHQSVGRKKGKVAPKQRRGRK